jgi:nucleoside-diphosphate-sugar epimerase
VTNNSVDALVTGAGGFIAGHLVKDLVRQGLTVRAVDIKPFGEWQQIVSEVDNHQLDLSDLQACKEAVRGVRWVYNLAADMGGMGFIENNKALCMLTVLESTHMLIAAKDEQVERFFYSSSACVYAADKQIDAEVTALKEADAYPAMPEDGYGWEKLFTERMCRHFQQDFGLNTRVGRYHNVYGPEGTYKGGREKAPAAICRKVAYAKLTGEEAISIWGDGEQTRSFMYVDDCVRGTQIVANGQFPDPINIGSAELISINKLVSMVEEIAGVQLKRDYNLSAPQGVRGRNSDNTLIRERYRWEPSISLWTGLEKTFAWIYDNVRRDLRTG